MKRRNFFKLLGISPAALMFKPKKEELKYATLNIIDAEVVSKITIDNFYDGMNALDNLSKRINFDLIKLRYDK